MYAQITNHLSRLYYRGSYREFRARSHVLGSIRPTPKARKTVVEHGSRRRVAWHQGARVARYPISGWQTPPRSTSEFGSWWAELLNMKMGVSSLRAFRI